MGIKRFTKLSVVAGMMSMVFIIMLTFPNPDWKYIFYPAAQSILHLQSPYTISGYINPIWTIVPLIPLTIFTVEISRAIFAVISLSCTFWMCRKLQIETKHTILIVLSASVLNGIFQSNVEPLLLTGTLLHPAIGLILLSGKPQIGIGYIIYQLYWSWKERRLIQTFLPLGLLSMMLIPFIPEIIKASLLCVNSGWNISMFPYSVLPGIILLGIAIYKKQPLLSVAASILISPYIALYSLTGIQMAIAVYGGKHKTIMLVILFILTWIVEWMI
jgi:hypothetical protein